MNHIELSPPDRMTAGQRAAEVTTILARTIIRTIQENQGSESQVRLGFLPTGSVHTTPYQPEKKS